MAEQSLKDKTAKGLFWGGLNNGIQQLLNLLFGIFLARMLDAKDYGMVGMLSIFAFIAAALQESGFTAALANKPEVTDRDYNAVFWFSTGVSACLYILLFTCAPLIADFYHTPALTALARYSFLSFFVSSLGIAPGAYLFRNLKIKQKAFALTLGLLLSGTTGIILAYLGFAYWGIATQNIVYVGTITLCYWYFSPWRPSFRIDLRPLRGMLGFSSKLLVTNIFYHINNNLVTVVLGKFYSGQEVGYFTQANKWNYMGHSLITGTVNSVAQPVLSSLTDDRERQCRAFRKMLRFTAFIAFPALFGLSLIAPELIVITITEKWLPSASLLQVLCIGGAFLPITQLYSNLLISQGKSNIYMWNNILLGAVQLISLLMLYPYGVATMVKAYVAIPVGWFLIWHYFVGRELKISLFQALKDILPFAFIAAAVMITTYYLTQSITNLYLLITGKIILAALLYTGVLAASGSVTFRESLHYLLKKTNP